MGSWLSYYNIFTCLAAVVPFLTTFFIYSSGSLSNRLLADLISTKVPFVWWTLAAFQDFSHLRCFNCRSLFVLPLYLVGTFFSAWNKHGSFHPKLLPASASPSNKPTVIHLTLQKELLNNSPCPCTSLASLIFVCLCCGCSKPSFMHWFIF